MRTLRIVADLTYDDDIMHGSDPEAIEWFIENVLLGSGLVLHDNGDIGDHIGEMKVVSIDGPATFVRPVKS